MLSLLLAIISASLMYLVFKYAGLKQLQVFPIILVNYLTCVILSAIIWNDRFAEYFTIASPQLFGTTTLTGACFIGAFFLMAVATKKIGVATSTTISRMSMIFPTLFTVLVFKDKFNYFTVIGFILSLVVIYFIIIKGTDKKEELEPRKDSNLLLLLGLFVGFGVCDILNKSITRVFFDNQFHPLVMFFIYLTAFVIASIVFIIGKIKNPNSKSLEWKPLSIVLGIFLGSVNLAALYFFLLALTDESLTAPAVFSINSIGILTFSTVISMLFFKEKLNKWKWYGIGISLVAIIFLNLK